MEKTTTMEDWWNIIATEYQSEIQKAISLAYQRGISDYQETMEVQRRSIKHELSNIFHHHNTSIPEYNDDDDDDNSSHDEICDINEPVIKKSIRMTMRMILLQQKAHLRKKKMMNIKDFVL
jgi:hypothetical protein